MTATGPLDGRWLRRRFAEAGPPSSSAAVAAAIRAEQAWRSGPDAAGLASRLYEELAGLGPLEPLLDDPLVTDVLVNAPDEVWVERDGRLEPVHVCFPDERHVRELAVRLATAAGRRLDRAAPFADLSLRPGLRVHAALPPVSPRGTQLSIRRQRAVALTLAQLIDARSVSPAGAQLLLDLVRARLGFLVTGGTGAGKTTLLSALLSCARPSERVLLVEEVAELNPTLPHVVQLQATAPNTEDAGAIGLAELIRQGLRMRPDRIVVGECRGPEVVDLLAALNTGHCGGAGTVHANRAADLPARIVALATGAGMSRAGAHAQLLAAVHAVVHIERAADAGRAVTELGVLAARPDGTAEVAIAWSGLAAGPRPGPGAERWASLTTTAPDGSR